MRALLLLQPLLKSFSLRYTIYRLFMNGTHRKNLGRLKWKPDCTLLREWTCVQFVSDRFFFLFILLSLLPASSSLRWWMSPVLLPRKRDTSFFWRFNSPSKTVHGASLRYWTAAFLFLSIVFTKNKDDAPTIDLALSFFATRTKSIPFNCIQQ